MPINLTVIAMGTDWFGSIWTVVLSLAFALEGNWKSVVSILVSCTIIYLLMLSLMEEPRTRDVTRPSTFFTISQITSRKWNNSLNFFYGGTLALTYGAVAIFAPQVLDQLKGVIITYGNFSKEQEASINNLAGAVPSWATPIFVMLICLLLFAPYVRNVMIVWRDTIVRASKLYRLADETSIDTAEDVLDLNARDYDAAMKFLEVHMSDVSVPEEFVGNKGPFRLAYQLLWLNRRDIRQNGIIGSFAQFRIKIGLKSDDLGPNIYMSRIIPSSIVFIVVIGSFILISAQYSDWAEITIGAGLILSNGVGFLLSIKSSYVAYFRHSMSAGIIHVSCKA